MEKINELDLPVEPEMSKQEQIRILKMFNEDARTLLNICRKWEQQKAEKNAFS